MTWRDITFLKLSAGLGRRFRVAVEKDAVCIRPGSDLLTAMGWQQGTEIGVAVGEGNTLGLCRLSGQTGGWLLRPSTKRNRPESLQIKLPKVIRGVTIFPGVPERSSSQIVEVIVVETEGGNKVLECELPWLPARKTHTGAIVSYNGDEAVVDWAAIDLYLHERSARGALARLLDDYLEMFGRDEIEAGGEKPGPEIIIGTISIEAATEIPSGQVAVEPEPKPPEAHIEAEDGAGSSSEAKARQSAPAAARPVSPERQEAQAKPAAPAERGGSPPSANDPATWKPQTRERFIAAAASGASQGELSAICGRPKGSIAFIISRYLKDDVAKAKRALARPIFPVSGVTDANGERPLLSDHILREVRLKAAPVLITDGHRVVKNKSGSAFLVDGEECSAEEVFARANKILELDNFDPVTLQPAGD